MCKDICSLHGRFECELSSREESQIPVTKEVLFESGQKVVSTKRVVLSESGLVGIVSLSRATASRIATNLSAFLARIFDTQMNRFHV